MSPTHSNNDLRNTRLAPPPSFLFLAKISLSWLIIIARSIELFVMIVKPEYSPGGYLEVRTCMTIVSLYLGICLMEMEREVGGLVHRRHHASIR